MSYDRFTLIVDQLLGHYGRILDEDPNSWPEIRESIVLVIGDHQDEVGSDHEGIARLQAFAAGPTID